MPCERGWSVLVPTGVRERDGLEEMADKWLEADREIVRRTDKSVGAVYGILSPDQWELREYREVLTKRGEFDEGIHSGNFRRVHVHLDCRPTCRRRLSLRQDPWRQDVFESGHGGVISAWFPSSRREEIVSGQHYETIWPRDVAGIVIPRQGFYHHLDRFQRCRIRATMCKVSGARAREVVMFVLAHHYGVPPWVIIRCVVKGKR